MQAATFYNIWKIPHMGDVVDIDGIQAF